MLSSQGFRGRGGGRRLEAVAIMDSSGHGQAQGQHEGADATTQKTADLTAFVQNLLLQMQTRFQTMSESIIT